MKCSALLVGSQAREHALALALLHGTSPCAISCFGSTYNSAIASICTQSGGSYHQGDITDSHSVTAFAIQHAITLIIIGPEAPLETGLADYARGQGLAVVGPDKDQARIETSKSFARNFLMNTIGHACPECYIVTSIDEATQALSLCKDHYVVKADGLTGGKGVLVSQEHLHSHQEALAYCNTLLQGPSAVCVIEEKLIGEEFSLMTITDGESCVHFPVVQDHKRAFDGDTGANTGGMGSYTDTNHLLPFLTQQEVSTAQQYNELVIRRLSQDTKKPYRGVLYGGYMATATGVKIIEYNARFGDPEVHNLMALLESDPYELFYKTATGNLSSYKAIYAPKASVCLYAVPEQYPMKIQKGDKIELGPIDDSTLLMHGSLTQNEQGELITAGSRTIALVSLGESIAEAAEHVLDSIKHIRGPLRYRTDIGTRQVLEKKIERMHRIKKPLSLAILGSTQGTDLLEIQERIEQGLLPATIALIISDRKEAGILKKGERFSIESHYIPRYKKTQQEQESEITHICTSLGVELIILIGYMRIVSKEFCNQWQGRIINVHPSLLPEFAASKDTDVHQSVITRMRETGNTITGCTVHEVTEEVDSGNILLQMTCIVTEEDTPETLKERVQQLEGIALSKVITSYHKKMRG